MNDIIDSIGLPVVLEQLAEEYSFTDEETERIREFILAIVEEHNSEATRKE